MEKTTEKKRQTGKKGKFAYTIKDKYFPDLRVLNTANAWWLDRAKVQALIDAFKIDSPIEEACVLAGISLDQYKYFVKLHSEFSSVKDSCKSLPVSTARTTVVANLGKSSHNSMEYLKRKKRIEFGDNVDHTTAGEKLSVTFDSAFDKKKKK